MRPEPRIEEQIDELARSFRFRETIRQLFEDCDFGNVGTLRSRAAEFRREFGVDIWPAIEDRLSK